MPLGEHRAAVIRFEVVMARTHFFLLPSSRPCEEQDWRPAVDIYRTAKGWLVKCDLAGVRQEDLQVTAAGRRLMISGVRRDLTLREGHRAYSLEIAYNRFARTVQMPCDLTEALLDVDYRDGMLLVSISGC
jgi:HSP20 family protein